LNTSQLSNLISLNKPLVSREINEIHEINQENSPDVGDIPSIKEFKELTELSDVIYAFKDKDKIIGFILLMREGSSYKSENYKFISSQYDKFLYVDRIAIQSNYRRRGLAETIYKKAINDAKRLGLDLLCEVNTRPRNDTSLAFHGKMGFTEIGTQDFKKNSVVYLCKKLIS